MDEVKEIEQELKGIAKVIFRVQEVYKFTLKYWYILGVVCGVVWASAKGYYYTYAEPEIRNFIVVVAKDSLAPLVPAVVDTVLSHRGVSFRVQLSEATKIPKDSVAKEYAKMYFEYRNQSKQLDSLRKYVNYLNGVIHLFADEIFTSFEAQNGAEILLAPSGDTYYFDVFGLLWSANWRSDGNYYYFPPYLNNAMLRCTKVNEQ